MPSDVGGVTTPNTTTPSNLSTPDIDAPDGSAERQSMIDSTQKMLEEQAWIQRFSIETNLRSQEIKTLADALKGIIQKMA